MRKLKLLLAACALFGVSAAWAQSDVTATYITNPSFESDGSKTASNGALTMTGWTQSDPTSSFNNTGCYDASTSIPTQGTVSVTPSDGTYFLYFRKGWAQNAYTFTSTAATLPAGAYTLSVDYKMVEGYDDKQNNTSYVGIAAMNGETPLGSKTGNTKTNVSGSNAYTYLNTAEWSTVTATFTIEESTSTTFVITLNAGGQRRTDFVIDNVKLFKEAFIDPTAITLEDISMIPTAKKTLTVAYTPVDANHNKAITWESSNPGVATVSDGVVTAVSVGAATITATTANGKSTTCEVTVNEAPLANGEYYILNVSKGKYLGGANDYGTRASVIDHGIIFTATLTNGAYTLDSHTYNGNDKHFLNGTYMDSNSTLFYISALGGNKFSLSTAEGSAFLTANDDNTVVANTADNASSELAQWQFVTKEELVATLATATSASPVDATFYIADQNFSRGYYPAGNGTSSWSVTASNKTLKGGAQTNMCAETYQNGGGTIYQTLTVPNGRYGVKCQGFYRQDSGSTPSYLYANGEKQELSVFNANSEGTDAGMNGASASFSAGHYQSTELIVNVTDGSLTVGIEGQGGNWTCFDNFELYYYGPTIGGEAEALPAGDMTAKKWYYFDIAIDDDYDLTLTTLSDIVYTTDATILVEDDATVTANFAKVSELPLTAGRYYVKSSSAQTLKVDAHSFTYEVGAATLSAANGAYTQNQVLTVTFPAATTNEPGVEPALVASSTATVNGNTVDLVTTTNGFTIDLGALTPATDYVVAIPADVYGYAGNSTNAAINLTLHTPAVFDGTYYMYNTDTKNYLSRGEKWGTQAILDNFGLAVFITTDADNKTLVKFFDGLQYLGDDGFCYTDCDGDRTRSFNVTKVSGGYKFLNTNNSKYLAVFENQAVGDAVEGDNLQGTSNVWSLETTGEHVANYTVCADAQAATATSHVPALSSITKKAALEAELAANYQATPITITGAKAEKFQQYSTTASASVANTYYSETVSELKPGLYKLTVDAYQRAAKNDWVAAADGARGVIYLYANNVKTQLKSVMEYGAPSAYSGDFEYEGKHYPDTESAGYDALATNNYVNEVFVYVAADEGKETGTLEIGIKNPTRLNDVGTWAVYNNWTLTRYDQKVNISETADYAPATVNNAYVTLTRTFSTENWNTFVVPFDIDNETLTAKLGTVEVAEYSESSADADNATVTFTKMETPAITANVPVLLKTSLAPASVTFESVQVKTDDAKVAGTNFDFVGSYAASTTIAAGDYFFNSNKLYKSTGKGSTIKGTRAYIKAKSEGARITNFVIDGEETTGIMNVEQGTVSLGKVYNMQGQQVKNAQKGIFIQNGKKVVIK